MLSKGLDSNQKDIHLVLHSAPLSDIYFYNYMNFINSIIFRYNTLIRQDQDKFKITSMTTSNLQAVMMLMYASDLPY